MDSKKIKEIYELAFPAIKAYVLKNSGSSEDAEDTFQDAMVVLYNRMKQPNFELTSKPETFLFAVARNLWYKKLRKPHMVEVTSSHTTVLTDEIKLDEEDKQTLRERLYRVKFKLLSSDCQQVIQLFLAGESMVDIAERMNYASEGYAKKKKFTCKQKLFSLISADPRYKDLTS